MLEIIWHMSPRSNTWIILKSCRLMTSLYLRDRWVWALADFFTSFFVYLKQTLQVEQTLEFGSMLVWKHRWISYRVVCEAYQRDPAFLPQTAQETCVAWAFSTASLGRAEENWKFCKWVKNFFSLLISHAICSKRTKLPDLLRSINFLICLEQL